MDRIFTRYLYFNLYDFYRLKIIFILMKLLIMAERQGFEPWVPLTVHTLSKRAP